MEGLIERIIAKKIGLADILFTMGIIILAAALPLISLGISFLRPLFIIFAAAAVFAAYYFISTRGIEYEYSFIGGNLTIDKIIAKKKRKNVLTAGCRDFDVIARPGSQYFTPEIRSLKKKLDLTASMKGPDIYFATLNMKGGKTLIYLEINEALYKAIRPYIPQKIHP